MTSAVLIISTCPTEKNAQDIASQIIDQQLAACVQMSQINSMFQWDGKIQQTPEWRLNVKTSSSKFEAVKNLIIKLHPYEVPAVEMFKIDDGNKEFLKWIKDSVN